MHINLTKDEKSLEQEFLCFCNTPMRAPYLNLHPLERRTILWSYELHRDWLLRGKKRNRMVTECVYKRNQDNIEFLAFIQNWIFHLSKNKHTPGLRFINIFNTTRKLTHGVDPYRDLRCRLVTAPSLFIRSSSRRLEEAKCFGEFIANKAIEQMAPTTTQEHLIMQKRIIEAAVMHSEYYEIGRGEMKKVNQPQDLTTPMKWKISKKWAKREKGE